jgi:hypothetical protein
MSNEVRHPFVVANGSKMASAVKGVEAGECDGRRVTDVMQDRRLLQDLSVVSTQQGSADDRSSPDTQRVRPTDRQLSCQEIVGYSFSASRGRLHMIESTER